MTFEEALAFTQDIFGWFGNNEAEMLHQFVLDLSALGPILEIGSWHGRSTIILASAAQQAGNRVFAVDPHEGHPPYGGPTLDIFLENLKRAGLSDVVEPLVMTSREAFEQLEGQEHFSFVFIDGNHDYDYVKEDFEMWSQCLVEGGVIAFHDREYGGGGPTRVIDEVKERSDYEFLSLVDASICFRKCSGK